MNRQYLYIGLLGALIIGVIVWEVARPKPLNWAESYSAKHTWPFGAKVLREQLPTLFPSAKVHTVDRPLAELLRDSLHVYLDDDDLEVVQKVTLRQNSDTKPFGLEDEATPEELPAPDTVQADTTQEAVEADTTTHYDLEVYLTDTLDAEDGPPVVHDLNFILINSGFAKFSDEYAEHTAYLLKFVANGGEVFMATYNLPSGLAQAFKLKTTTAPYGWLNRITREIAPEADTIDTDSIGCNFVNPLLRRAKPYNFDRSSLDMYFTSFDTARTTILGDDLRGRPNFIRVAFGKGFLYLHLNPLAFTNYNMLKEGNADYVAKALSYLPPAQTTYWDEYNKVGRVESASPFRFIANDPALKWAWSILLIGALLYVAFMGKRTQRIIPILERPRNTTLDFIQTVGKLYHQSGAHLSVAHKMIDYFLDHVRSTYYLPINALDDEFVQKLAAKSGVDLINVRELVNYIRMVRAAGSLSQEDLRVLHQFIQTFHEKTGPR